MSDPARPVVRRVGRRRVVSGPDPEPAGGEGSRGVADPAGTSDSAGSAAQTRDDTDEGWSQPPEPDHDEWLRGQRPPHWG